MRRIDKLHRELKEIQALKNEIVRIIDKNNVTFTTTEEFKGILIIDDIEDNEAEQPKKEVKKEIEKNLSVSKKIESQKPNCLTKEELDFINRTKPVSAAKKESILRYKNRKMEELFND